MFSFTTCPYYIKAKAILVENGAKYTVVELDKEQGGKVTSQRWERCSGGLQFLLFVSFGGCNDGSLGGTNRLNNLNQLDAMLKSAGAI
eukprot:CCRYP_004755-RA/>CCRYP_004755-RA protein AED:0.40 eAED:0.40 QI:0/-1/0/1/-1/1/1/0/87